MTDLFINIGGLSKSLIVIFGLLGSFLNDQVMIYKQIRNLYFIKKISKTKTKNYIGNINDTLNDDIRTSDLFYS